MRERHAGVALLGELGYSFDTWHYHLQNDGFAALAAPPDTQLVLDHFGTPVYVGAFQNRKSRSSKRGNGRSRRLLHAPMVAKIGGLAMPANGFGWIDRECPPSSDRWSPPIANIICTRSTVSARIAACSRATSRSTRCRSDTRLLERHEKRPRNSATANKPRCLPAPRGASTACRRRHDSVELHAAPPPA